MSEDTPDSPPKLPVWKTVRQAYAFAWNQKLQFLKLALLPVGAVLIGSWIFNYKWLVVYVTDEFDMGLSDAVDLVFVPHSIIQGLFYVVIIAAFSVVWHRLFLVKSETQTIKNLILWRERHRKFLITAIILGLAGYAASTPVQIWLSMLQVEFIMELYDRDGSGLVLLFSLVSAPVMSTMALLVAGFVTARWSIMFPSIAVDRFISFKESWRLTSGNGLRLWAITFLAIAPVQLLSFLVLAFFFWTEPRTGLQLVKSVSYLISTAVGISALSASYRFICLGTRNLAEVSD